MIRIVLAGGVAIQRDGLVGNDADRPIGRCGVDTLGVQVLLGACDEEGASLMQDVKAREIDVAAIHDVICAGFGDELIQDIDIAGFAIRYADKRRNIAVQVEQRMHLHGCFVAPKFGPGKQ